MKRNRVLPTFFIALSLLLSACASSGSTAVGTPAAAPAPSQAMDYAAAEESKAYLDDSRLNLTEYSTVTGYGTAVSGSRVYTDAESKLIRQASVSIQTTDFQTAVAALDKLTADLGGYYENAQTQGGDYYDSNARRYANYTVRIPKDNYDAFLEAAGDIGHVVSSSESSTDVGDQYYDTELRLKTLQTKQERLMALLEKADLMEDIITIENSLSDVQYQIEQYTSTLKRYDGLVDFATINISINEVIKLSDEPGEAASLGERLSDAFARGFSDFGTGLGNFTVWIAYHFVGTAVFAAVVAAGIVTGRRVLLRRRGRADQGGKNDSSGQSGQ